METMREHWTDDRLDDLTRRMDNGFNRVDADLRALRGEMNARFDSMESRFAALQRVMLVFSGSLAVALLGMLATHA